MVQMTEAADILSAFEDGAIDVVVNDPSSITNLGYASTNEKRTFYTTNLHFIAFNEETTLGRYSNVRSALSYAVDRDYFEELTKGNGVGTPIPMVPTVDIYPTAMANSHGFDMERCLRILNNYGITDFDEDGRLELAAGSAQEMDMVMIVPADSSVKAGMAHRLADTLAEIGFTIRVRELSWDEYVQALEDGFITEKNEEKTPFDIFYGEVKLRNNFDLTELLQVRTKDNEDTNINFTRSTDRTFENYINAYLAASESNRAQKYEELCQYLLDTGSLISVGFEKQEIFTHRGVVKGVDPNAGNPMYNFENWEIDLGGRRKHRPLPPGRRFRLPAQACRLCDGGRKAGGERGPRRRLRGGREGPHRHAHRPRHREGRARLRPGEPGRHRERHPQPPHQPGAEGSRHHEARHRLHRQGRFIRGFLYCVLLCWVLSFFGIVIGRTTLEDTALARFFLSFDFITRGLL